MKVFSLRNLMVAIVAVFTLSALASCGGFSCTDKGKCKNDTAPSQSSIDLCKKAQAGKCGGEYDDFASCLESSETCDSSGNGKIDAPNIDISDPANPKFTGNCADQANKMLSCCKTNPTADGCSG